MAPRDLERENLELREKLAAAESALVSASTDHLSALEAARRSGEMFETAFRVSPVAVAITSLSDGCFVAVNDAAVALAGRPREEILGRTAVELEFWADPSHRERMLEEMAADGRVLDFPSKVRRRDGELRDVLLTTEWLEIAGQRCALGALRDVSEQRQAEAALQQAEEKLRQAQKMEAIGTLAGGIAHDFNNLLSVILSYTGLLIADLPANDPIRPDIEDIAKAADSARVLTRQLLAFSRQQVLEPRVVDINKIVQGVERVLERAVREDVELLVLTSQDTGRVFVDPGQIEQILMNLAVNARDAMPNGGTVTIKTSPAIVTSPIGAAPTSVQPGRYAVLSVEDTGLGMTDATKERIFEPFFTTKGAGKGTGLGLATVFGIVQQSGGHIVVATEVGRGSTFRVFLPESTRRAKTSQRGTLSGLGRAADARGSETVLVVEDEPQVRRTMCAILRRYGYDVLEAPTAEEAEDICQTHDTKIELLITDMVMPRMNGYELALRLVKIRPTMRVLLVSGYPENPSDCSQAGALNAAYLQKPIIPAPFAAKVRDMLDED